MTDTPCYWHDKVAEAKEKKRLKRAKASVKVNRQRAKKGSKRRK